MTENKKFEKKSEVGVYDLAHMAKCKRNEAGPYAAREVLRAYAEIDRLEQREAQLVEFARSIIKTRCWGVEDDGGTIQDEAERIGLIVPVVATKKNLKSHRVEDCEPGDTFYVFADWLKPPTGETP